MSDQMVRLEGAFDESDFIESDIGVTHPRSHPRRRALSGSCWAKEFQSPGYLANFSPRESEIPRNCEEWGKVKVLVRQGKVLNVRNVTVRFKRGRNR